MIEHIQQEIENTKRTICQLEQELYLSPQWLALEEAKKTLYQQEEALWLYQANECKSKLEGVYECRTGHSVCVERSRKLGVEVIPMDSPTQYSYVIVRKDLSNICHVRLGEWEVDKDTGVSNFPVHVYVGDLRFNIETVVVGNGSDEPSAWLNAYEYLSGLGIIK